MFLSNAAINNRSTIAVVTLIIVVFGLFSYFTLPRENFPDIPTPFIIVTTAYEGVAPADVESSITIKLEKELTNLKGLKEMKSSSAEGVSTIQLEFLPGVSTDAAMQHVRDKVDLAKPELPDAAEEPTLTEINLAEFPIMMISISGDVSPFQLKLIADSLEDAKIGRAHV